jgi:hypothetical protein
MLKCNQEYIGKLTYERLASVVQLAVALDHPMEVQEHLVAATLH